MIPEERVKELNLWYNSLVRNADAFDVTLISDLKERMKKLHSFSEKKELSDEEWGFYEKLNSDLKGESERLSIFRQRKITEAFRQKIISLEKICMKNQDIPAHDKKEISDYLRIRNEDGMFDYTADQFIESFNKVEDKYKLAFLRITQNILFDKKRDSDDYKSHLDLEEKLPGLIEQIPAEVKDRYISVLVAAAQAGKYQGRIHILARTMAKQLTELKKELFSNLMPVNKKDRDLYLEFAQKVAENSKADIFESDFLKTIPILIEKHGADETRKILETALKIKQSDFPDETHTSLFYLGVKAGYNYAGSLSEEKNREKIVKSVEQRYRTK